MPVLSPGQYYHWPGQYYCQYCHLARCHEYKLGGSPWWAEGEQAVASRRLLGSLVAALRHTGWEVGEQDARTFLIPMHEISLICQRIAAFLAAFN